MAEEPYRISFGQSEPYQPGGVKVYKSKKGCLSFLFFMLVLIAVVIGGIFFVYPAMTPNKLRGDFLAAIVVPGKDGSYKLWIQTDGSFNYIQKVTTPGSFSMGRKCFFCKTWTYIYDPVEGKVIEKFKTEYDDIIPTPKIFFNNGKVWIVSGTFMTTEPMVNIYDASSGALVTDTKAFSNKYPALKSGIVNLRTENEPDRLIMDTRDGRTGIIYVLDEDKIYENNSEFRKAIESRTGEISLLVLAGDNSSSPRKKLYKVTGPANKLLGNSSIETYAPNEHSIKFFLNSTVAPLGNAVYIEPILLHQDAEGALILHQDQAGKKANRMLTYVDASGREKWTARQEELFDELELDEDENPFGKTFFLKSKVDGERIGGLVTLELEQVGLMGFDASTGKKLWELEF